MSVIRKAVSKMLSPLDRYIQRRVTPQRRIKELIREEASSIAERMVMRTMPKERLSFIVHLADHCNLNCRGCDNFAPVARQELLDYHEYERDCKRLSELFNGMAGRIGLMGGEPLLNPDITQFMRISRECFPNTNKVETHDIGGGGIFIETNGLLLPKMDDRFWDCCRKYDIGIRPTKYPISVDYDAIEQMVKDKGINFGYFNNAEVVKTLFKLPLDMEGLQSVYHSFLNCHRANECTMLRHGRLYTCSVAPCALLLKEHFNLDIELSPDDSIDIYKASSAQEILQFLARPIPFCRYCKIDQIEWDLPYSQSSKSLDEWT